MGIDGIGKPGAGTAPGVGSAGESNAPVARDAFQVEGPIESNALTTSHELARLKRGELTLDEYLDGRVEEAVSHLAQKLTQVQLTFVKETVREQLSTDPVLIELVRRVTV